MDTSHGWGRRSGRLTLALAVAALALPVTAQAASVTPTDVVGNPSCADIDESWSELKIDALPKNQTYGNDDLSVTISDVTGNETFDWAATRSVDAVLVKSGTHTLAYAYSPESFGDSGVSGPAGYDISHVSFCYDPGDAPPPPPTCAEANAGSPDGDGDGTPDVCEPAPPTDSGNNGGANNGGGNGGGNPSPADQGEAAAPATEQQAVPEQLLLGERIGAVRANLLAPSGCMSRTFSARVRGAGIASVAFRLDGRKIRAVRTKAGFVTRINAARLGIGVHRLVATVRFTASSRAKTRTLRASFQRCSKRLLAPRFTG